jgi:hypothetical protein
MMMKQRNEDADDDNCVNDDHCGVNGDDNDANDDDRTLRTSLMQYDRTGQRQSCAMMIVYV